MRILLAGLWLLLMLFQLFTQFSDRIFEGYHIALLFFWGILFLLSGSSLIQALIQRMRYRKEIRQRGETPYYRETVSYLKNRTRVICFWNCVLSSGLGDAK